MNPQKKRDDPQMQMQMPRQPSNRKLEEPVYYAPNDAKQMDRNIHDMEN